MKRYAVFAESRSLQTIQDMLCVQKNAHITINWNMEENEVQILNTENG